MTASLSAQERQELIRLLKQCSNNLDEQETS
jgi:hypothetical protein